MGINLKSAYISDSENIVELYGNKEQEGTLSLLLSRWFLNWLVQYQIHQI